MGLTSKILSYFFSALWVILGYQTLPQTRSSHKTDVGYFWQVLIELQNDFFPNFMLCTTTQRFVRSPKPPKRPIKRLAPPPVDSSFLCGTPVSFKTRTEVATCQWWVKQFSLNTSIHSIQAILGSVDKE